MNKNLLVIMEERMSEFSKGQKRIARYILDHYDKAAYMTASRLGSIVEVSESTVVRFAIEVGFDGYIRPDHGRMIWGESGRPGYGLYDRALGAVYINGIWEALDRAERGE